MMSRIGLNCALSTPFGQTGAIDIPRLVAHAHWVLNNGCDGLTLFGTTGEGASIGVPGRYQMLAALAGGGIDLRSRVIAGVSAASAHEVYDQCKAGYDMNVRGLLLAPPFYFTGVSDEGLFRFFSGVFEKLGPHLRDVILYHIPGMTGVPISIALTKRLAKAFPGKIIGIKDSAGDADATDQRLKELAGLQVLVGDERQLARAVRNGGAGSICGLANVAPDLLAPLANQGKEDIRVNRMVDAILGYSFMPAIKALIADRMGDPAWRNMRAPLDPLDDKDATALAAAVNAVRMQKPALMA